MNGERTHATVLTATVERLSTADSLDGVTGIVAHAVRELTGADGATFVLREDGNCFYADEDAVGPLWKGSRFPLTACISGWAMLHQETVVVPDIYEDERIPHDAYRPTFVRSLAMAPIRAADPIGALGAYWPEEHTATAEEIRTLEVLANSAAIAVENLELRGTVVRRSAERDTLVARTHELEQAIHSMFHDLRSPLAAMVWSADLIAQDPGGPDVTEWAETIATSGLRLGEQIDRMLALYRVTSRPIEAQPVDVTALSRDIARQHTERNPERSIEFSAEDGLWALADPVLARLLLDNLIGNAVKYTGRTPEARISLAARSQAPGDSLTTFAVADNGAGFDPAQTDRLFHPMTRLHSTDEFPGTGLGLASVARIVERHGGRVGAESVLGEGASFSFSLPVA